MTIPSDKLKHLAAGAIAAIFSALIGAALGTFIKLLIPLWPWNAATACVTGAICAAVGAGMAGATKEAADKMDNDRPDLPDIHGVSVADALFTTAPGIALAAVLVAIAWWLLP